MPSRNPPDRSATLFLDACAILNYVKPHILKSLLPKRLPPKRVEAIRDFIIKCNEKAIRPVSCQTAYDQAKEYREHFRREFTPHFSQRHIDRVISAAEHKIKDFLSRVRMVDASNRRYNEVESFFKRYKNDSRMLALAKRKRARANGRPISVLPDMADMEIFAQALMFNGLIFVTTDNHFGVLVGEIEEEFGVLIITADNAHIRLREWGW